MINSSIPYHMTTTSSDFTATSTTKNIMLDQSMADMHGPISRGHSRDTKPRKDSGFSEDKHFTTLTDPVEPAPQVIVFFSFMNPCSYSWAVKHEIVHNIRRNVSQGTTILRYHAPMQFSWNFGYILTHAWAVAESLEVDDQVIEPLFKAVQGKRITDLEGVRTVFDEVGIPPDMFLKEWGKPWVMSRKEAMEKAAAHVELKDVPAILVQGKYMVNLDSFGDAFNADKAVYLVKDLLVRP